MTRRSKDGNGGERDAAPGRRTLAFLREHLGESLVEAAGGAGAAALPAAGLALPGPAPHAIVFASWTAALDSARALAQRYPGLPLLRVANARETQAALALAADRDAWRSGLLSAYLVLRGCGHDEAKKLRCLLLLGAEAGMPAAALRLCRQRGGLHVGRTIGDAWRHSHAGDGLWRDAARRHGYAVGALEAAVGWPDAAALAGAVERSAAASFAVQRERVLTRISLSHPGGQGAGVHMHFVYRRSGDDGEDLRRWTVLEAAVRRAVAACGGRIPPAPATPS